MISNEMLSAYIDDELSPADRAAVDTALASDEVLAARLREFRRVDDMLGEFCGAIDREPLPAAVLALLNGAGAGATATPPAANVVPLPGRRAAPRLRAAALAAGVVLAVLAALQLRTGPDAGPGMDALARTGPIARDNPLARTLDELPADQSRTVAGGLAITPVLSFLTRDGTACREFRLDAPQRGARGIACRGTAGWETLELVETRGGAREGDGYATASADGNARFEAFVDGLIAGDPLDAAGEARLMRQGWRPPTP